MRNELSMKGPKKFGAIRRREVQTSSEEWVRMADLKPGAPLPLVLSPAVEGVDLAQWCAGHRGLIGEKLRHHGGILFRGFRLASTEEFEGLVAAVSGELLRYSYRSTPRTEVEGKIYTSTEYPADQSIPMHNEMSYSRSWPMKIWFYCVEPAASGGETPFADSRRVYQAIDPAIRQTFERKGVQYVRNYGGHLDLPWQEVFQTKDRQQVEAFCRGSDIEWEWRDGDRLRTRQTCQAVATHPTTGEPVWFNQAHLFHVSSLPPAVREPLLAAVDEADLPRNAYYGDGTALEEAVLEQIQEAYRQALVVFPWEKGDLVLLDNMLAAHGRRPFSGSRRILVGMAEAAGPSGIEAAGEELRG